jgi:hypothetical protein
MRHVLCALALAGCTVGAPSVPNPPVLQVVSPARSTIQGEAGQLVVSGTVAQNPNGAPVARVDVNGVAATLAPDGSFAATLDLAPGATLLHTVATDLAGGTATDTRSIEAGTIVAAGTSISNAIATSISATAFAKIAGAATTLIKTTNLTAVVQPLNPVVTVGSGGDCINAQASIDSVAISNAKITLAPVAGGLQVGAELDGLDVTGHMTYALLCAPGSSTFSVSATSVVVGGVLDLQPMGGSGLSVTIAKPDVQLAGLDITATGLPGDILNLLPIDQVIEVFAPLAGQAFLTPIINDALGSLTKPMSISLMGETIDFEVAPSAVSFGSASGTVALDMMLLIEGTGSGAGFTSTPSGMPQLSPGNGLALGLCDDLANEALAELTTTGLLNLSLPSMGGAAAALSATSPPMMSANGSGGELQLYLPDMIMTISENGSVTGKVALNVEVGVDITPAQDATSVQINLGTPTVALDPLTPADADALEGTDVETPANNGTGSQLGSITQLLQSIPLPKILGLQLTDTSVTGNNGYAVVQTTLQ